jgi:hypothetical protein
MKNSKIKSIKNHPTIFPLGFSVGRADGDILIVEFMDRNSNEEVTIINSFALTIKKAKELSEALISACDDNEN